MSRYSIVIIDEAHKRAIDNEELSAIVVLWRERCSPTSTDLADPLRRSSSPSNFRVVIRLRPSSASLPEDIQVSDRSRRQITIHEHHDWLGMSDPAARQTFTFDHVFDGDATQEEVYHGTADVAIRSVLEGYNDRDHDRGIVPRVVHDLSEAGGNHNGVVVRASYVQIYNEVISDLLAPESFPLPLRESRSQGIFVDGLSSWRVHSPEQIYDLIRGGSSSSATAATRSNAISSRSHAVFALTIERPGPDQGQFSVGKLNLVDLAGSERIGISGSTGQRLQESKNIDQSLSSLGNVISALTSCRHRHHIPYRLLIFTGIVHLFATSAKSIRNEAHVNEDLSAMTSEALIRRYERELAGLREVAGIDQTDRQLLVEVHEQRRSAERDHRLAVESLAEMGRDLYEQMANRRALELTLEAIVRRNSDDGQGERGLR